MNKNLKKILVTGAALLMFASVGAGLGSNANAAHHNIGWRQVTRATNLRAKRGKRIHLRKNQSVFVIKFTNHNQFAEIKVGRKYYKVQAKLLKQAKVRKAVKKYKKANQRIKKQHARKYANQRKQAAKNFTRRINKKARNHRTHKRTNYKHGRALKPRYRRSNNPKLWMQSGFIDFTHFPIPFTDQFINAGPDIMSKYAPNSRKAVIPKGLNVNKRVWLQGNHPFQKNPKVFIYSKAAHGWEQQF